MSVEIGKFLFVGGGAMGEALLAGFVSAGLLRPQQISVVEPDGDRRIRLVDTYGVEGLEALTPVVLHPGDVCLLAVKPQVVGEVLPQLALRLNGALLLSIAAGVTLEYLEGALPDDTPVVRVMPNTPAMVRVGMALLSAGQRVEPAHMRIVVQLFESVGRAAVVPEELQNAGAAISGCGPAYFALVIDALSRAGVAQGLPRALAQELAAQTAAGTAKLLLDSGQHPEVLIDAVASPGGTTIRALAELESGGVRTAFFEAVEAAVWRSEELEADVDSDDEYDEYDEE
ncbi:MAG: pyrroline-5-carboxylate reductase [Actinomycetes bacterium]|jgi:pyrroline-5-carboxylate reductase|nr:pyrroline-5-carboxylate reductase [Actinomycetes bacterium]